MYSQRTSKAPANICIAGGGHAGMSTAIRLMRHARGPMNIYLFEKNGMGGVGYAKESTDAGHDLNLQAERVTLLREDPTHFMRWAEFKQGKAEFKGDKVDPSSPVSRRTFGEYCWDTMWEEAKHQPMLDASFYLKSPQVNLYFCKGTAAGFHEDEQGRVSVAFGDAPKLIMSTEGLEAIRHEAYLNMHKSGLLHRNPFKALLAYASILPPLPSELPADKEIQLPKTFDQLVLATGHLEVKKPEALKRYAKNDSASGVEIDQYTPEAFAMMDNAAAKARKDDTVLIMGSALAALDPVISMVKRCQKLGKEPPNFILCSRNAHRHFTYSDNHRHRALHISRPDILDHEGTLTLSQIEAAIPGIWKKATEEAIKQDGAISANPRLGDERILKAMESYVTELMKKMLAKDVQKGLDKWGSYIATRRIGVVPRIGNVIDELEKIGKLRLVAGELASFADGEATLKHKGGKEEKLKPLLLVNSIGRNFDYSDTTSEFWNNADFLPQQKTKRGVELTEDSRLVRRNGEPYKNVRVVGVASIGDEMERYGRLGAFSQSQGPIKVRAMRVAHDINLAISDPIPEVAQYSQFVKERKGDLGDFLETLPEAGARPLSKEGRTVLARLDKIFDLRCDNMVKQLYAEAHGEWPSAAMAKLEADIHGWAGEISGFAADYRVPRHEHALLRYAMHIMLEQRIADAKERCCDLTKAPDTMVHHVTGR